MARMTRPRQSQVLKSDNVQDNLPLPSYGDLQTLEDDLNYLRSILRDTKGTLTYDSPVTASLEHLVTHLEDMLEGKTLNNIQLSGSSTASTPPIGNNSSRIATTEFVQTALAGTGANDKHFEAEKLDPMLLEWVVVHGLNKKPSVIFENSAGRTKEVSVQYLDDNTVRLTFSRPASGKAIFN